MKCLICRIGGWMGRLILTILLLFASLWAFGALWFDFPLVEIRPWAAGAFGLLIILWSVLIRPRWLTVIGVILAVGLVGAWWSSIPARQHRDWKPEVALTSHIKLDGDIATIHNLRNFDYRSTEDFTPRYELRKVDLRKLRGMDVFINYWGSPYMAHPIFSYDFGDDGRVCFSIETRPEKGESYSALGGLYRRFELFYVVADERDVIRLRSNYRSGEDVYLYHLGLKGARESFLEYVRTVNELHENPRWYNAVANNCTTAIRKQKLASDRLPLDWRLIVNGFGDELLYDRGQLDRSLPFSELKRISRVNEKAKAADQALDFSERIRKGLPGM
ncbi:MAG: hypothetical protein RLY69_104 [Verrucomicrobiota bacterium]